MNWHDITADQFAEARERAGGVALIPVGSTERHGPHLPLGCDSLVGAGVAARVAALEPVVVLPVMTFTWVPQPSFHPGAINIKSALLLDWLTCVLDEVHRNGFTKIVLMHCHGGNTPMGPLALGHVLEERKAYSLYSIPPFAGADVREVMETDDWGHACEIETSVAMALFPELVRMELVGDQTFPAQGVLDLGAAQTPVDWIAEYPGCCVGEPQAATPEKGERLVSAWVDNVVDALRKIKTDTVVAEWMARATTH